MSRLNYVETGKASTACMKDTPHVPLKFFSKKKNEQGFGRRAVCGRLRREQASGRRNQRPSARGPIRGMRFETCSKCQPRTRLVREVVFRHPSSLRLPRLEDSVMVPPRSPKNAVICAMGALCVFQPFPLHHCKIASRQKVGMVSGPPKHALLASCAPCSASSMTQKCAQVLC